MHHLRTAAGPVVSAAMKILPVSCSHMCLVLAGSGCTRRIVNSVNPLVLPLFFQSTSRIVNSVCLLVLPLFFRSTSRIVNSICPLILPRFSTVY